MEGRLAEDVGLRDGRRNLGVMWLVMIVSIVPGAFWSSCGGKFLSGVYGARAAGLDFLEICDSSSVHSLFSHIDFSKTGYGSVQGSTDITLRMRYRIFPGRSLKGSTLATKREA